MYLCACRLIFQFFAVARTLGPKIFKKTVGENRKNKVKDQILSLKKKAYNAKALFWELKLSRLHEKYSKKENKKKKIISE